MVWSSVQLFHIWVLMLCLGLIIISTFSQLLAALLLCHLAAFNLQHLSDDISIVDSENYLGTLKELSRYIYIALVIFSEGHTYNVLEMCHSHHVVYQWLHDDEPADNIFLVWLWHFFSFKDRVSILLQCGFVYYFFITLSTAGGVHLSPTSMVQHMRTSRVLHLSAFTFVLLSTKAWGTLCTSNVLLASHGLSMAAWWWTSKQYIISGQTQRFFSLREGEYIVMSHSLLCLHYLADK